MRKLITILNLIAIITVGNTALGYDACITQQSTICSNYEQSGGYQGNLHSIGNTNHCSTYDTLCYHPNTSANDPFYAWVSDCNECVYGYGLVKKTDDDYGNLFCTIEYKTCEKCSQTCSGNSASDWKTYSDGYVYRSVCKNGCVTYEYRCNEGYSPLDKTFDQPYGCTKDCAEPCTSTTEWKLSEVACIQSRKICENNCVVRTEYRCNDGCYGTASSDGTSGCTACPKSGRKNGQSVAGSNKAITSCYLSGAFSDSTGSGTYTNNCYYKE